MGTQGEEQRCASLSTLRLLDELVVCLGASRGATGTVRLMCERMKAEVLDLTQPSVFWPL